MGYYSDTPAVGDVVHPLPDVVRGRMWVKDMQYVVTEVHDFRRDADPALHLTLVEESVYMSWVSRQRCPLPAWSPWHVTVGAEEVVWAACDGCGASAGEDCGPGCLSREAVA